MSLRIKPLFSLGIAAITTSAHSAIILIGAGVNNGDFNADTSTTDQRTFAQTPSWTNYLGSPTRTAAATRTNNSAADGSRNAQLQETGDTQHIFGNAATGAAGTYTIAEGDQYDISYEWRDAFNWNDASDQIQVTLFTTDDDLITGTATALGVANSGTSTSNNSYQSFSQNNLYTATAADAGKALFVSINTLDGNSSTNGFARLDNFILEVTPVPEPTSLFLSSFGLLFLTRRRR